MDSFLWTLEASSDLERKLTGIAGSIKKSLDATFSPFIKSIEKFLSGNFLGQIIKSQAELTRVVLQMGLAKKEVINIQKATYEIGKNLGISSKNAEEYVNSMLKGRVVTKDIINLGTAMGKFEEVTGASNKSIIKFTTNYMKLKNVSSDSIKSILTGMAQVQKSLGLTSEGLDSVLDGIGDLLMNIKAIGGSTDNVKSMAKATTTLAATFEKAGLEANKASQFMNQVFSTEGFEKFLPLMAKLGYSASDYSNIISGNSSIQGDFNKKIMELGDEVERLMKNSPLAAKAFSDAWTGGVLSPEELIKLTKTRKEERKVAEDLEKMWGESSDTIGRNITKLHGFFENFLKGLLSRLLPIVEPFANAVIKLLKNIPFEKYANIIEKKVDEFVKYTKNFNLSDLSKKIFNTITTGIINLFNYLLPKIIKGISDAIKNNLPLIIKNISNWIKFSIEEIKKITKELPPVVTAIIGLTIAINVISTAFKAFQSIKLITEISKLSNMIKGMSATSNIAQQTVKTTSMPILSALSAIPIPALAAIVTAVIAAGVGAFIYQRYFSVEGIRDRIVELGKKIEGFKDEILSNTQKEVVLSKDIQLTQDPEQKDLMRKQLNQLQIQTKLLELQLKSSEGKTVIFAQRQLKNEELTSSSKIVQQLMGKNTETMSKDLKNIFSKYGNIVTESGIINKDVISQLVKTKEGMDYLLNLTSMKEGLKIDQELSGEYKKLAESLDKFSLGDMSFKMDKKGMEDFFKTIGGKEQGFGKYLSDELAKKNEVIIKNLSSLITDKTSSDEIKKKASKELDEYLKGTKKVDTGYIKILLDRFKKQATFDQSILEAVDNVVKVSTLDSEKNEVIKKTIQSFNKTVDLNNQNQEIIQSNNQSLEKSKAAIWGVEKGAFVVQEEAKDNSIITNELLSQMVDLMSQIVTSNKDVQKIISVNLLSNKKGLTQL